MWPHILPAHAHTVAGQQRNHPAGCKGLPGCCSSQQLQDGWGRTAAPVPSTRLQTELGPPLQVLAQHAAAVVVAGDAAAAVVAGVAADAQVLLLRLLPLADWGGRWLLLACLLHVSHHLC